MKWRHSDGSGKPSQKVDPGTEKRDSATKTSDDISQSSSLVGSKGLPESTNRCNPLALIAPKGGTNKQHDPDRDWHGNFELDEIDRIIDSFTGFDSVSPQILSHRVTAGHIWTLDDDRPDLSSSKFDAEFQTPMLKPIDDRMIILSSHYFSVVCMINSCFDSPVNPFRSVIGDLMASSQLVYHVVMTASASHICHQKKDMTSLALRHRGDAVSCLVQNKHITGSRRFEALLSSVLLGMTSSWQDPSKLGLSHINSARTLFRKWIDELGTSNNTRSVRFMVGIMAYWEAMASFLTMDSARSLDYLTPFCGQESSDATVYPNPWTGTSTTLFIYAAKAGALCRQNRMTNSVSVGTFSSDARKSIFREQLRSASKLEEKTLRYTPPEPEKIEDPNDASTPVSHFQILAQIYRFAVLLQLYLTFPELLQQNLAPTSDLGMNTSSSAPLPHDISKKTAVGLAISLLNLISSVPESSGIKVLLTLPLIIAGSALQNNGSDQVSPCHQTKAARIQDEIQSLQSSDSMLSHWRSYIRHKLKALHEYVGLDPILRASQILEAVWLRADLAIPDGSTKPEGVIHWLDVMIEERLESVFG